MVLLSVYTVVHTALWGKYRNAWRIKNNPKNWNKKINFTTYDQDPEPNIKSFNHILENMFMFNKQPAEPTENMNPQIPQMLC